MTIKRTIHHVLLLSLMLSPVMAGHIYAATVPAKTEASAAAAKISLNKADVKVLMQVKGMNAYKAHAITAYRKQNGDFKTVDDLVKVKGFKRMKPENMKSMIEQLQLD
jgi:competence ComEA-like helix-hairpin-helix protein